MILLDKVILSPKPIKPKPYLLFNLLSSREFFRDAFLRKRRSYYLPFSKSVKEKITQYLVAGKYVAHNKMRQAIIGLTLTL